MYTGAQCEGTYPATEAYASGVMLIHSPWDTKFELREGNKNLLPEFLEFVKDTDRCPASVRVAYERARQMKMMKEPTSKSGDVDYGTYSFLDGEPDQQVKEIVALAGALYVPHDMYQDEETISYDYGLNYDWSKPTVKVRIHVCNSR